MSGTNDEAWGQLVCTSDPIVDNVLIRKDRFVIGRSKGADLSLTGNKLLSGSHCIIVKDDNGLIWLKDTSSNGTLLNYKTKLSGEKAKLEHGDEFHLVYKKDETHLNVSYMYQDLLILKAEEEEETTLEYSDPDTSATSITQDDCSSPSSPEKLATKRRRDSDNGEANDEKIIKKFKVDGKVYDMATQNVEMIETDEKRESEGETSRENEEENERKNKENKTEEKKEEIKEEKKETKGMEDDLICIICQEILHDCVSCQPCLHCFCGGCYSGWMKRSDECPACRVKVDKVNRNHMVNKVVATFLREHPDRKRAQEELDELDKRNTIKTDSVKPRPPRRTMSEYIDDEDMEDEDDEEDPDYDADDDGGLVTTSPFGTGVLGTTTTSPGFRFSGMTGLFGTVHTTYRPPKTVCRQCPEYKEDGTSSTIAATASAVTGAIVKMVGMVTGSGGSTTGSGGASAGPSTSTTDDTDMKSMPTAPVYKCPDSQVHLMCQCCMKPMPDRRTQRLTDETIPHQQCTLCFRMFCHMYWGCRRDECLGCLGKFKEVNFGKKILATLVLENNYESEVLKGYLEEQGMSTKDLLKECCVRLEAGDYTTADQVRGFTQNTVTCFSCGLRNFRELAYQYRADVPNDAIPSAARSRPKCYWGKGCRTQRKMAHAVGIDFIFSNK